MFDTVTSNTGTFETGALFPADLFSPEQVSLAIAKEKGMRLFIDSLVICFIATQTSQSPKFDHLLSMLNAVTGWDMTTEEALNSGLGSKCWTFFIERWAGTENRASLCPRRWNI